MTGGTGPTGVLGFVGSEGATGDTGLPGVPAESAAADTGPTGVTGSTGPAPSIYVGTAAFSEAVGRFVTIVGVTGSTSVPTTKSIWFGGLEPTNAVAATGAVGLSEFYFTNNGGTWDYAIYLWSPINQTPSYKVSWQYNG